MLKTKLKITLAGLLGVAGLATAGVVGAAPSGPSTTVVVKQTDLASGIADVVSHPQKWFMYDDNHDSINNTLGSFVTGPGAPPHGLGSLQFTLDATNTRDNIATYQFSGTTLSSITKLSYTAYSHSGVAGPNESPFLQFNVDFNGSDSWQKRLVYVPSVNGSVPQDSWNTYDAINGGNALWVYSGTTWPVTGQPGTTAKTWNQILTDYPGIRVRVTDSWLGIRVGEPGPVNYVGNIDSFTLGTASGTTTYDFEPTVGPPTNKGDCKNGGWMTFNNPSFANQGKCISYVNKHSPATSLWGVLNLSNPNQKVKFDIHNFWLGWPHLHNKFTVDYTNYDYPGGLSYKTDVLCMGGDKSLGEARVMYQIPAGHPDLSGLYVVAYVKDVKGHNAKDQYGHSATADLTTATAWCKTGSGFTPTMYAVSSGDIRLR